MCKGGKSEIPYYMMNVVEKTNQVQGGLGVGRRGGGVNSSIWIKFVFKFLRLRFAYRNNFIYSNPFIKLITNLLFIAWPTILLTPAIVDTPRKVSY